MNEPREKNNRRIFERASRFFQKIGIREIIPVITLALLLLLSGFLSSSFFSLDNITNLLRQNAILTIVSMGMLLTILTGGIDLSVGSMVALGAVLVANFNLQMAPLLSLLLTVPILMVLGAFTGYFVAFRRVAPFVMTLALMTMARGLAYIISKGSPIRIKEGGWLLPFGNGSVLGIPYPVVMALVFFGLTLFVLRYTSFGRLVKAVGSNESAVRLSGIRVGAYKFAVYVVSGGLCAFAGLVSAARAGVGSAQVGSGLELDAIAAVVIGGASLSGGKGNALNTLMGVFILGLINNIMNLMNVSSYNQMIIKGLVIVGAVLLQSGKRKETII